MHGLPRHPGWAATLAALAGVGAYLLLPVGGVELSLRAAGEERSVLFPVAAHDRVSIGFEHSLYRTEQIETYAVRDRELLLESVSFGNFDALNYYDPLGELPREREGAGYRVVFRPPRPEPVSFAIAHETPVWLRVGAAPPVALSDLPAEFTRFSLRAVRVPRIQSLLERPSP